MAGNGIMGNMNKTRVMVLGVIGLVLVIAGIAVATIHSELRGSGLGTAMILLGIVVLIIVAYPFFKKSM